MKTALDYLDELKDDAAVHIWPDDLAKCQTSECVVEVASVRLGSPDGKTVPLFSREQVAAALQWAASQQAAEGAADEAELRLFEETVEQFEDCGETDTPYETLMRWAARGWLECQHFVTTAEGNRALAALETPLFASPPSTQGGEDA